MVTQTQQVASRKRSRAGEPTQASPPLNGGVHKRPRTLSDRSNMGFPPPHHPNPSSFPLGTAALPVALHPAALQAAYAWHRPLLQAVANGAKAAAAATDKPRNFTLDDLVHKALENEKKNASTREAEGQGQLATAPSGRPSPSPAAPTSEPAASISPASNSSPAPPANTHPPPRAEALPMLEATTQTSTEVAASQALLKLARSNAAQQAQHKVTAGVVPASNGPPSPGRNCEPGTTLVPPTPTSIQQKSENEKQALAAQQMLLAAGVAAQRHANGWTGVAAQRQAAQRHAAVVAAQQRHAAAQQQQQQAGKHKSGVIPAKQTGSNSKDQHGQRTNSPVSSATAILEQALGAPQQVTAMGISKNMQMMYRSLPMQQAMYAHSPLLFAALQNQQRIMNMNISHIQLKKMITETPADPDNFCPCGRLLLQAYIADPCGHEFCEKCMNAHQTTGKEFPRCGACEQTLYPKLTLVPALTRRKTVSQIKCRCLYEHCPETLTLGNLSNHLKNECSVHAQVLQSYTLRAGGPLPRSSLP